VLRPSSPDVPRTGSAGDFRLWHPSGADQDQEGPIGLERTRLQWVANGLKLPFGPAEANGREQVQRVVIRPASMSRGSIMTKCLGIALAITGIVLGLCLIERTRAFETPPVKVVVDGRMVVRGTAGDGLLPVAVSQNWSRPLPEVTRAVIVVHGAHRTAQPYFGAITSLVSGNATLVITPQFLLEKADQRER
jgi:hypothetical protein